MYSVASEHHTGQQSPPQASSSLVSCVQTWAFEVRNEVSTCSNTKFIDRRSDLLPGIFSGILAIYGLVANHIEVQLSLYTALVNLGSGLAVGLCGLASGFALGIVGDVGTRSLVQQPRLFVSMVLILIFAEVLGE